MSDEQQITDIITKWAKSVENQDRNGILAAHSENVFMIDFPNSVRGIAAYAKTWDFFDQSRRGKVIFQPKDIEVTAGETVAFAHCDVRCEGTTAGPIYFRLTTCFVKIGDEWIIAHEHHSMPTENEAMIGPEI